MWLSIGLNLGSLRKLSVNNYRHAYEEEKVAVEEGFMKKLERKVIELLKRKESVVDDKHYRWTRQLMFGMDETRFGTVICVCVLYNQAGFKIYMYLLFKYTK